jgi:hypothetical protein
MELRDMGQKVLWRERRSGRGTAQAREVNVGLRALFLPNMAEAHGFELACGEEGELK